MAKSYAVLGIGRFGGSVASALFDSGEDVMIVDRDEKRLAQFADHATYAVQAELSDEDAVKNLGLGEMDTVVIAMGMDLEASLLCVMVAKEQGAGKVIAKAQTHRMGDILTRVGVDQVIYPEEESGVRVAHMLISKDFLDFFEITDKVVLLEMKVKEEWVGKTVRDVPFRRDYKANVVGLKHGEDGEFLYLLDPSVPFQAGDVLLLTIEKNTLSSII